MTIDGGDKVRNGLLDWVYQEEIYGRGNFRGYWWSPDSSRLAYLRLDGADVPTFTVLDHIPYHPEVEHWDYPKAGDRNPDARLGIIRANGGETTWVDLAEYEPSQPLVVDVGWTPDGARVVFQIQDREQTWLDLNVATPAGDRTRLLRETTKAWVNINGTAHVARGRVLPVVLRTDWVEASLSSPSRREPGAPDHGRPLGGARSSMASMRQPDGSTSLAQNGATSDATCIEYVSTARRSRACPEAPGHPPSAVQSKSDALP